MCSAIFLTGYYSKTAFSLKNKWEIHNPSPSAPGSLKYITSLVILNIDDDPKGVGFKLFLDPDLQLKILESIKFKTRPSCTV